MSGANVIDRIFDIELNYRDNNGWLESYPVPQPKDDGILPEGEWPADRGRWTNNFGCGYLPEQPCLIEQFFKNEQSKPPHLRSNSCMIACPCPRHTIYC